MLLSAERHPPSDILMSGCLSAGTFYLIIKKAGADMKYSLFYVIIIMKVQNSCFI